MRCVLARGRVRRCRPNRLAAPGRIGQTGAAIICQSPSEMSLAEAVAEPLPVICRTMPETR
jgi:hypothetical protein